MSVTSFGTAIGRDAVPVALVTTANCRSPEASRLQPGAPNAVKGSGSARPSQVVRDTPRNTTAAVWAGAALRSRRYVLPSVGTPAAASRGTPLVPAQPVPYAATVACAW